MDSMIALGDGNGTFQTPAIVAAGTFTKAVGDFNGDGRLDLIGGSTAATVFVLLQTGAQLSPTALVYPSPHLSGSSSAPLTTTLKNIGSADLAITSVSVAGTNPGDFAQSNNCPSTLASNASCQISVVFTPTAGGSRSANLQVAYNATGSPQIAPLSGKGQDFSLAVSGKNTKTVTPGQSASYMILLSPEGGFAETVSLSCTGAPVRSTCELSPTSLALNGKSNPSANVTIMTTSNTAAILLPTAAPWSNPPFGLWLVLSGVIGLAVLMYQTRTAWRGSSSWLGALAFVGVLSLASAMSGCGGATPGSNGIGTPAGAYNLTVTGTFSSGSITLTRSANLSLVVQ